MNVTEPTTKLPQRAHPSDFDFLRRLITELDLVPTKEKVIFPLPGRTSVFSDIECELAYDTNGKPYAEFFFRIRRHELEMAHSAVVFGTVEDGELMYQLQIKPNKRLRSNGHKTLNSVHTTAKAVALAICRNYAPGTVGRKVIPLVIKKPEVPADKIGWPVGANGL
jgi:hypothetical protein